MFEAGHIVRGDRHPVDAHSWYEPFLNATTTHGTSVLLTTVLPLALSLYLLWLVARRPLSSLLGARAPQSERRGEGTTARWCWISASLALGAVTHLL